jgi:hypothetical protein
MSAPNASRVSAMLALLACDASITGCKNPFDAFAECPGYRQTVDDGGKVNGVDPAASVSPLLGRSDGVIVWELGATMSPVHVTITPDRPSDAVWNDCPDPPQLTGFDVPVTIGIVSDDGLLDTSTSGQISLSPSGTVRPGSSLVGSIRRDNASDAGVLVDGLDASSPYLSVTLWLRADGGAGLQSGRIDDGTTTIATLSFGP